MRQEKDPTEEEQDAVVNSILGTYVVFVIFCVILFCLSGCTKTIYVPQESVRIEYVDRVRVDSVNVHDSVFISEKQRGDTIYLKEFRYKNVYVDREVHDTICRTDSIPVPYEVEVVRYHTRGAVKALAWVGALALLLAAAWIYRRINGVK